MEPVHARTARNPDGTYAMVCDACFRAYVADRDTTWIDAILGDHEACVRWAAANDYDAVPTDEQWETHGDALVDAILALWDRDIVRLSGEQSTYNDDRRDGRESRLPLPRRMCMQFPGRLDFLGYFLLKVQSPRPVVDALTRLWKEIDDDDFGHCCEWIVNAINTDYHNMFDLPLAAKFNILDRCLPHLPLIPLTSHSCHIKFNDKLAIKYILESGAKGCTALMNHVSMYTYQCHATTIVSNGGLPFFKSIIKYSAEVKRVFAATVLDAAKNTNERGSSRINASMLYYTAAVALRDAEGRTAVVERGLAEGLYPTRALLACLVCDTQDPAAAVQLLGRVAENCLDVYKNSMWQQRERDAFFVRINAYINQLIPRIDVTSPDVRAAMIRFTNFAFTQVPERPRIFATAAAIFHHPDASFRLHEEAGFPVELKDILAAAAAMLFSSRRTRLTSGRARAILALSAHVQHDGNREVRQSRGTLQLAAARTIHKNWAALHAAVMSYPNYIARALAVTYCPTCDAFAKTPHDGVAATLAPFLVNELPAPHPITRKRVRES